jgi:hypothetical protein
MAVSQSQRLASPETSRTHMSGNVIAKGQRRIGH